MPADKGTDLVIPPEPKEIRARIAELRSQLRAGYYGVAIWAGNVPGYLWSFWKDELKSRGYTWPKFMRLMKDVDEITSWYVGKLSWENFVKKVIVSIEGAEK
jgi:hypothetical protein